MFRSTKIITPLTPRAKKMCEEVNQNIQVFVRCRPLNTNEKKGHIDLIPEKRTIKTSQQNKSYTFDNVFDAHTKQHDVYLAVVEPLVEQVIEGYNCTVFAYGQTGTGKTYTMIGNRSDVDVSWEDDPTSGIIPRAIDQLLEELECQQTEYTIRVSYLELYNEEAYDLLSPLSDNTKLRIYNDTERKGSVIISGLVEIVVKTKAEIFEILEKGSLKRQTAPTLMNACSSRSHSIFSITVHIKEVTLDGEEVVKMGKLNLVDLAGSENIGRSGAIEERAREASNINKSLLTLGRVITSLVEKSSHIPYRDSKLTRLLQDSLGGKTKTSIIATISPGFEDFEDTISTLDYAQRAKKITNKPEINLKLSKKTLISEYLFEIEKLRRDLEAARDKKGVYVDAKNFAEMEATIKAQEQSIEVKEARIEFLKEEIDKYSALLNETKENLESKCVELDTTRQVLNKVSENLDVTSKNLEKSQIEVKEKEVLLEAHQTTESKLLNEAKSIMSVTDKCVNDNDFLFKKIDSYTSLEDYNFQLINQFMQTYSAQVDKITNLNSVIYSTINRGIYSIENIIRANKEQISNKESEARNTLTGFETSFANFQTQLLKSIEDEKQLGQRNSTIMQLLTEFKSQMSNTLQGQCERFAKNEQNTIDILNELIAASKRNRNSLEDFFLAQISKIDETSRHVISTIQSIKDDYVQSYKNKCLENEQLVKEISELKQVIANDRMSSHIDELQKCIDNIRKEQTERNGNIVTSLDGLQSAITMSNAKQTEAKNHFEYKSKEFINFHKREKEDYTTVLTEFDRLNCQLYQNFIEKFEEMRQIRSEAEEEQKAFGAKSVCHLDDILASVDGHLRATKEVAQLLIEDKSKCLSSFDGQLKAFVGNNTEWIQSIVANMVGSNTTALAEYSNVSSYCEALKRSQDIQIQEFAKQIERLCRNGLKVYQATGCTPQKCTYSYPRTLSATSPHERILNRFRALKLKHESLDENGTDTDSNIELSDQESFKSDSENANETYSIKSVEDKARPPMQRRKFLKEKN